MAAGSISLTPEDLSDLTRDGGSGPMTLAASGVIS
jgi:hypothetical protein